MLDQYTLTAAGIFQHHWKKNKKQEAQETKS